MKKKVKQPLVEVMVLSYNNKSRLDKCLASLKNTEYDNLIVTVIDNASHEEVPIMVRKKYPSVNLIANKENKGFSMGYNAVLKKTKAK